MRRIAARLQHLLLHHRGHRLCRHGLFGQRRHAGKQHVIRRNPGDQLWQDIALAAGCNGYAGRAAKGKIGCDLKRADRSPDDQHVVAAKPLNPGILRAVLRPQCAGEAADPGDARNDRRAFRAAGDHHPGKGIAPCPVTRSPVDPPAGAFARDPFNAGAKADMTVQVELARIAIKIGQHVFAGGENRHGAIMRTVRKPAERAAGVGAHARPCRAGRSARIPLPAKPLRRFEDMGLQAMLLEPPGRGKASGAGPDDRNRSGHGH